MYRRLVLELGDEAQFFEMASFSRKVCKPMNTVTCDALVFVSTMEEPNSHNGRCVYLVKFSNYANASTLVCEDCFAEGWRES